MSIAYKLACGIVIFCASGNSALAQDMPLSQVLLDGQGWELVA